MTDVLRVSRKELTSTEVLAELKRGNRVIVEVDLLGVTMNMALRRRAGTYYCDTPVKLLTYETDEEMRTCLERYRLARSESDDEPTGDEAAGDKSTDTESTDVGE